MLGHFQTYGQVEAAIEPQRLGQIVGLKPLAVDQQLFAIDVVAINTQIVGYSRCRELSQPRADATAHVNHAGGSHVLEDQRDHGAGGAALPPGLAPAQAARLACMLVRGQGGACYIHIVAV
jgi:hypothetical protein